MTAPTRSDRARTRTIRVPWELMYGGQRRGRERLDGMRREADYVFRHANGQRAFTITCYRARDGRKEMDVRRPLRYDKDDPGSRKSRPLAKLLYNLPRVIEAREAGEEIWLTEGLRDAENVKAQGKVATSVAWGALHWHDNYTRTLTGAHVVIVIDNDEPGRKRLEMVYEALEPVARSLHVLRPPEGVKDVSDVLDSGGSLDDLVPIEVVEQ